MSDAISILIVDDEPACQELFQDFRLADPLRIAGVRLTDVKGDAFNFDFFKHGAFG